MNFVDRNPGKFKLLDSDGPREGTAKTSKQDNAKSAALFWATEIFGDLKKLGWFERPS